MRILLDVNILVRANEKATGPARTLLLMIVEQPHVLLLSSDIITELTEVLRSSRLQALYGLTDDDLYEYIRFLQNACEFVSVDRLLSVPIRDPKDIAVLQTAVTGGADIICTLDSDFSDPQTVSYCTNLGIEICNDLELMRRIRQ